MTPTRLLMPIDSNLLSADNFHLGIKEYRGLGAV